MSKKIAIPLVLVALVIAAVAAGLFWLRGNLDGLVKEAIEHYGSQMTQAKVTVRQVEIRPADGQGFIRGLVIGNPKGFKTAHALKVEEIEVAIDLASVAGEVVNIRKIGIRAPDVIYEKGEVMTNFDALQKNIAESLGPSEKKKEGGKKLIVGELAVLDARAQASAAFMDGKTVTVPLPDIVLKDLGKAQGGIPPEALGNEIVKALKQKLSNAVSFDNLMKSTKQGLDKAGTAIKGLFK